MRQNLEDDFLRVQAERVKSLAVIADPITKARLLSLAQRYDDELKARRTDGYCPDILYRTPSEP